MPATAAILTRRAAATAKGVRTDCSLIPQTTGSSDHLRLLVLSQAVPESSYAGSLLLWRLLRDYPVDRLLVIGPRPSPESLVLGCRYEVLRDVRLARLYRTRLHRLKRSLELFGVDGEVSMRKVGRIAEAFQPNVVLTVMQESQYYRAAARLCSRHGWPMLLWAHDLVECFEPVYPWARQRQRQRNIEVYRGAAARCCISPAMAARLCCDFGASGSVLYPSRSDELTPRDPTDSGSLRTPGQLTIGYAGSLAYGYREGIESILPGVEAAGAILRVYSGAPPPISSEHVSYGGFASDPLATWTRVKAECDVVVLPYGSVESYRDLHETHFPSKLTEYLGLGMPVLITGPSYAAGVVWGLCHGQASLTIVDPSLSLVRKACQRLREENPLRVELAAAAVRAGLAEFDPSSIRLQFLGRLRELSSTSSL